ncbi:MAG: hypothetical protein ACOCWQ_05305 [Nanoarchaeota archaeon]
MYYALRCPSCGTWRSCITENITRFRLSCFRCGATRKAIQQKGRGLELAGPFPSALECRVYVAKMNTSSRRLQTDPIDGQFLTYTRTD